MSANVLRGHVGRRDVVLRSDRYGFHPDVRQGSALSPDLPLGDPRQLVRPLLHLRRRFTGKTDHVLLQLVDPPADLRVPHYR